MIYDEGVTIGHEFAGVVAEAGPGARWPRAPG